MAEKPPPSRVIEQVALMAAEERGVRIAGDFKRGDGLPSSEQYLSRADRSSKEKGPTLRVL